MTGDVGIRELKAHLSEIVARAAAGERIRITDRGAPRALLVPLPGIDRTAVGIAEGWITSGPNVGKPFPRDRKRFKPLPGVTGASIIDEDRGE